MSILFGLVLRVLLFLPSIFNEQDDKIESEFNKLNTYHKTKSKKQAHSTANTRNEINSGHGGHLDNLGVL